MTTTPKQRKTQRHFKGIVVSSKPNKTVVVRIDRTVVHPKYGKRYLLSTKVHAHDEHNTFAEGDVVTIRACRPMSATKRWCVVVDKNKKES